jgi:hypothetical protein
VPRLPRTSALSVLESALDKAVTIPSATIHAHVESVRRGHPDASPERVIELLEREYLTLVTAAGAVVGAAAATPGVGTGVGITLTVSDIAAFFGASAGFALAVASVHGIEVADTTRRRALLLATVLGEKGATTVDEVAEVGSLAFASTLLTRMPLPTVRRVNRALSRRLVRRQLGKQSAFAVGRLAPFGIGAVIGVVGARALGHVMLDGARIAFGPAPEGFAQAVTARRAIEASGQAVTSESARAPGSSRRRSLRVGRGRRHPGMR